MHVDDVLEHVRSCVPYMQRSGGGITVSGGDPLVQADFVGNLFRRVREELKLTATLDTTGFGNEDIWNKVLPHTDHVLLCVKHAEPEKYKQIANVDGHATMLQFISHVQQRGIPINLRYVLVPGLSDSESDVQQLIELAKQVKTLRCIELLPYHKLGLFKYSELGVAYPLEGVQSPTAAQVAATVEQIRSAGVKVIV